jgi:hypothetical protein
MTKKRGHLKLIGRVPPDDPIYTSGYVMLRPVHGRKQEEAKTTPPELPTKGANKSIFDDPTIEKLMREGFKAQLEQKGESRFPTSPTAPSPAQTPPLPGQETIAPHEAERGDSTDPDQESSGPGK